MNRIVHLALLFSLVWWSGAIAAGGGNRVEYELGAGDKVKITVFGHDDPKGSAERPSSAAVITSARSL